MLLDLPTRVATPPSSRRATTRLILVGDSTVCEQGLASNYRGWGQYFFADSPHFTVLNRAKSGASTKTFREEGLWDEVLQLRPDWVLMQFGHNDSHAATAPESTRANGDYAENLRRFVADLRAIHAQAVLVTPVRRFVFGPDNRLIEDASALSAYAAAMRAVGCETGVPVADLFAASTRFFERLGPAASDALSPAPGEDFSHFNETGARAVAALVEAELAQVAPTLMAR